MADWFKPLTDGIRQAFLQGEPANIAVHSEAQAELGKSAAMRMTTNPITLARARRRLSKSEAETLINFVVIPEGERDQYPIGANLVS